MPQGEEDSVLVARAQHDRAAFAPLYDRHVLSVYRYCYRLLENQEAAEDATSETFTKAIAALPRYASRPGNSSFRSWLFAIAHNVAMDMHRCKRPVPLADTWEGIDTDPLPEERAISMEASQQLHTMLADLTADQQTVMQLRMAGLTGVEIAQVLNRTPQAVKSIQFRAISQLRQVLGTEEERRDARHARRTR